MKVSLKAARVNAGLTQTEAAQSIGVTKLSVLKWENGRSKPRPDHLDSLLALYGVSRRDIFLPTKST